MADDVISKIKDQVDIVDLISSYLKLQKTGANYKARCPFHNEKTGSFFVSPERQIWHCFGCSKGGDIFGFIKEIEGLEFVDALRILATRAGIELSAYSPEQRQFQSAKTKYYEICELAMRFFEKQLHGSTAGGQVLRYLNERGLTLESIKNFRLGFAPDSWNALGDFLEKKYSNDEILNAGLTVKSEKQSGRYYDRFRSRIMFPIFDINGQTVGFSGRIFGDSSDEANAKYVNTPQTLIYDKSRILYGLDKAKLSIRQKNRCLAVEGNMDVIMSHQAGATNAVATSGTALTDGHLKIIKRYTDNLDLCFDSDEAGVMATTRGVDLALTRGFNVGVVAMNESEIKDPADYVKKYGSNWVNFAETSVPFMQFFFDRAKNNFDLATALGKKLFSQNLLPLVASFANKIEQAHWVNELALALKLKEDIVYAELNEIKPKIIGGGVDEYSSDRKKLESSEAQSADATTRLNQLEETLLSLAVKNPDLLVNVRPENEIFLSDYCRQILKKLSELQEEDEGKITAQLAVQVEPALKMSLDIIYLKAQELWKDFEDLEMGREFDKLLVQAKRHSVLAQLEKLEYEIKSAERDKNKALLASLMTEFSKTSKDLAN